jgi:uncharacterized iron-regulated protein
MIREKLKHSGRPAYQFYDKAGVKRTYQEVLDQLGQADVVLFGEFHDNGVVHLLQHEVTRDLFEVKRDGLVLGAEMFEADNQLILNEYLNGKIRHEHLVNEAKVWGNYESDYRPLVEFAREHALPFVATNIPRRYASLVAREGVESLEDLSGEAKHFIAPLPIEVDLATPGYPEMMEMGGGHGSHMKPENFVAAQAVKDATMAHFILTQFDRGGLVIHFNGDYHSRKYGGIYWYLKRFEPELHVATISSVQNETLEFEEEFAGFGDFVLVIP